MNGFNDV